jgi:hypothetical protein
MAKITSYVDGFESSIGNIQLNDKTDGFIIEMLWERLRALVLAARSA